MQLYYVYQLMDLRSSRKHPRAPGGVTIVSMSPGGRDTYYWCAPSVHHYKGIHHYSAGVDPEGVVYGAHTHWWVGHSDFCSIC